MPVRLSHRRSRPRLRPAPAAPRLPFDSASIATAHPLEPARLIGVPPSIVLRNRPDDEHDSNLPEKKALASLRKWLRPDDTADDAHGFITIAAARAFPTVPVLEGFSINQTYGYCHKAIVQRMDEDDSFARLWYREREYKGPALLLSTDTHVYTDIGNVAQRIYEHDAAAAKWMIHALAGLPWWCYGPGNWLFQVQMSFWQGESDEKEAANGCAPDPWEGPTTKSVRKALPRWVWSVMEKRDATRFKWRKHCRIKVPPPPEEAVSNLRMSARLADLGIDATGLLAADGSFLSDDSRMALSVPVDTFDHPVRFGWKKGDVFEQALDEAYHIASQCGFGCHDFAWHPARDPARCIEDYNATTLPLLKGLSRFSESLTKLKLKTLYLNVR